MDAPSQARLLGAMVTSAMSRNRIEGMSAAVVSGGQRVLSAGYGWADKARRIPVTPDSIFPLGSVTKLFTATAVMQLVERGDVDLDAPVTRYLDPASRGLGAGPWPTVRQLLTHHGGLPGNHMEGFQLVIPDPLRFRELPRLLAGDPSSFLPDTVFAYSNAGYGLLGCLVEQVSGRPYVDFVTGGILSPLGMSSTRFYTTPEDGVQSVKGYEDGRERTIYPIRDVPAGSLMSTAADMERFLRFVIGQGRERVLGNGAFAEMLRRQNAAVVMDGEFPIGLGYWLIRPFPAEDAFASHAGDIPPFHAVLVTIPARETGLFLAANSSGAASSLIPLAVEMIRRIYSWQVGHPVTDAPVPDRIRLDGARLDALAGHYASPMGLIDIRHRAGKLLATMQGLPLELVPRAQGVFTPELSVLGLASIRLAQLAPLRLSFFEAGGGSYVRVAALGVLAGVGERYAPAQAPAAWRLRVGRYRILRRDENVDYTWPANVALLWNREHGLLLSYDFPGLRAVFPLATPDDSHAIIRGKGTGLGESITARDEGPGTALEWSGMLLEHE